MGVCGVAGGGGGAVTVLAAGARTGGTAGWADGVATAGTRVFVDPHARGAVVLATGVGLAAGTARQEGPAPGLALPVRRSASFPRLGGGPEAARAADRSGDGTRVSKRRRSWTLRINILISRTEVAAEKDTDLRCGSWSTICVSIRYTVAT